MPEKGFKGRAGKVPSGAPGRADGANRLGRLGPTAFRPAKGRGPQGPEPGLEFITFGQSRELSKYSGSGPRPGERASIHDGFQKIARPERDGGP